MKVGFVGLGKLGMPCALAINQKGHDVIGYDVNPQCMQKDSFPHREIGPNGEPSIEPMLRESSLQFGSLEEVVKQSEVIFVPIQTPHDTKYEGTTRIPKHRKDFDYRYLMKGINEISKVVDQIEEDRIVIIISTVLPGTVRKYLMPIMSKRIKLCYNPFFIAMGTTMRDFLNPEFVLFGVHDDDAATKAEELYKTLHDKPFYKTTIENAELIKVAYNCYSADTEVLTNNGWKYFNEVDIKEQIFSLNPNTHEVEWSDIDKIIYKQYSGPMLHFYSKKDSILVTPDHNMYIGTMSSKPEGDKNYSYNWKLEKANEIIKRNSFSFLRNSNWEGDDLEYIILCSSKIKKHTYVKFMAWYLAEGCVSQISSNSYQITICQDKDKNPDKYKEIKETIIDILEDLGEKPDFYEGKSSITFYHKQLGNYLIQFGNSYFKFIPKIIKDLDKKSIELFLNSYRKADGSRQQRKTFDGKLKENSFSNYFATSSNQMAADIAELIIKKGNFPSYRWCSTDISSRKCHLIYELTQLTSNFQRSSNVGIKYEELEYDGNIGCVILEKNHIFLTRRNGKCTWQGNTFIGMKIAFVNTLMEICHHSPNTNVDAVTDALKLATDRLISPSYLSAGMGDGGGCHPRDNIALSWLAQELDLKYDWFESVMTAREKQTEFLADLIENKCKEKGKIYGITIIGKAFKPETNLTTGSPAILLANILEERGIKVRHVDPIIDGHDPVSVVNEIYFIGTRHKCIKDYVFPKGSIVIDPFRFINPDKSPGMEYIPVGIGEKNV